MSKKTSGYVTDSQRRKKLFAIEQFGGKCQMCGYDKCPSALQFHHIDSSTKKEDPSYLIMRKTWKIAFEELQKCLLVCANCHAEIHYIDKNIDLKIYKLPILTKICEHCQLNFETVNSDQQYCGNKCRSHGNRKVVNRPTKEILIELLKNNSFVGVGKLFGVSDNAIRKWIK